MGKYADRAKELFLQGYNCSQSVLLAFGELTGLEPDTAARAALGFGGGMGRLRETCGAVNGMVMTAGLIDGGDVGDKQAKSRNYALVQKLVNDYKAENGSINCGELLGGNINTDNSPNASERTKEYYKKRPCAEYVYSAALILEKNLGL